MKERLLVYFVLLLQVFIGCSPKILQVPVERVKEIHIRDSVYFTDTLVRIELEKARLSDFVDLGDTLVLQTDLARSTAFLDTTAGKLKGTIENIKPYAEKPISVKNKIEYRDTVIYSEIPVPVEVEKEVIVVPWYAKVLSFFGVIFLITVALYVGKKFL